jgi:hypothetical protein
VTGPFVPSPGRVVVNGEDAATLSLYGAHLLRSEGLLDGLDVGDATEPGVLTTRAAWRAVRTSAAPTVGPRVVTLGFAVGAASAAALRTKLARFKRAWLIATASSTGVVLEVPAQADDTGTLWRLTGGVVTRLGTVERKVVGEVTVTLSFADPVFEATALTTTALSSTAAILPVGSAPSELVIVVAGPATAPAVELRDWTHTNVLASVAFAGLTLASGDTLTVNAETGQITKTVSGVTSTALPDRTAGRPIVVQPAHAIWTNVGQPFPVIRTTAAVGGASQVTHRVRSV